MHVVQYSSCSCPCSCIVVGVVCRVENTNTWALETGHRTQATGYRIYINRCILDTVVCVRGMFYGWYVTSMYSLQSTYVVYGVCSCLTGLSV